MFSANMILRMWTTVVGTIIPEPGALALMGLGMLAMLTRKR